MANANETSFPQTDEERILEKRAREARRNKRKKNRKIEDNPLNINSMMDMMTIILVFLIDSYGNNPIQVKASPDLVIPESVSELDPQETMVITVTRKGVFVGDDHVVAVKDGQVDKSKKRGGENSLHIQPLFDQLNKSVEHHKRIAAIRRKPFDGVATLVIDRTVPYRLLTEVMYTAGQAQLSNFKFAVIRFSREDRAKKAANDAAGK